MDDYCWIHSTFHVRSEFQGNVGCILDTVLAGQNSLAMAAAETPDTAFYQWVPFTLVFQVRYSMIWFDLDYSRNNIEICFCQNRYMITFYFFWFRPYYSIFPGNVGGHLKGVLWKHLVSNIWYRSKLYWKCIRYNQKRLFRSKIN